MRPGHFCHALSVLLACEMQVRMLLCRYVSSINMSTESYMRAILPIGALFAGGPFSLLMAVRANYSKKT